ncbi:MAG: 6-phosphofructokinase [Candidatus Manganitrophaceae bacterium]|nr:MAG: 6-phosphofructokinase [Candidatus Manganitrophaceae bacterium]
MKRIGILTSGGDAPGMNAAIRAVTRTAIAAGMAVFGVRRGYAGLIAGDFIPLGARDVGGIIERGGTFLGSARSPAFMTEEGRRKAMAVVEANGLEALVVIGGNGSQTGAHHLSQMGLPVVGVASTIDNDLAGSEITIGVDTALNIALEAIDRLKTTAASHQRAFLVEVMGRDCGYLALMSGIAGGAEVVAIPEAPCDPETMARELRAAYDRGKSHAIAVVAEGAKHKASEIAAHFREHHERIGFELRVTSLGHVQRGGAPGAFDRLLASRLGAAAGDLLSQGKSGVLVGLIRGEITATPLSEVAGKKKPLDLRLLDLARLLAQ